MSRATTLVTAALLALFSCLPMHADEASKRAKIEELFTLIHMERTLDQIADQQAAQVKKLIPSLVPEENLTASQRKDIDAFADQVNGMVRDAIAWQRLKGQYADLYAATYDEPTIDGIVAFYKSDAGRNMVAKQSELIVKSQGIAQQQLTELQPKMRATFDDFMRKMQQGQTPPATQKPGPAVQPKTPAAK